MCKVFKLLVNVLPGQINVACNYLISIKRASHKYMFNKAGQQASRPTGGQQGHGTFKHSNIQALIQTLFRPAAAEAAAASSCADCKLKHLIALFLRHCVKWG